MKTRMKTRMDGLPAARRPIVGPGGALLLLATMWALTALGLGGLVRWTAGQFGSQWVALPAAFVGFDAAVGFALIVAIAVRVRRELAARAVPADGPVTPVSVLVAAFNEEEAIGETLTALMAQEGVELEILVGDDGSRDRTVAVAEALLPAARARGVRLVVHRLPHAGKGAALNALAARARHPVLITLDADTTPAPGSLLAMARAFRDPAVVSAAGTVTVRNARTNWLTRHQHVEYQKIAWVRAAWSSLGALEQVPGAFTGVRADWFHQAGGFPTDSLTEDYELTYRLIERGARDGRVPVVVTVPEAQVFTEVPHTLSGFVRQRTRWFTGFLTTLAKFRHLIGEPRAAAFGLVRLPLKVVDALMPLAAFSSLAVVASSPAAAIVAFFAARVTWDVIFHAAVTTANLALERRPDARYEAGPLSVWACVLTDSLAYAWLRSAATLRAYAWAARRIQVWEPSRGPVEVAPAAEA